jgi:tRNA-Thr(GGU) m(6)t(6)A37 methyltransferase TsaA
MLIVLFVTAAILAGSLLSGLPSQAGSSEQVPSFVVRPVGKIHQRGTETTIEIEPNYQDAMLGLEGFSHVWVIWWFDQNDTPEKRATLRVHPRGNKTNPLQGVFATRSPSRPNLIAMTLCKIQAIDGNTIRVENLDAFDQTPVLDLKPYLPGYDGDGKATVPAWVNNR